MGSGSVVGSLVNIELNGESRQVEGTLDILAMVQSLGLNPGWVVVEHNLHALDRKLWAQTPLSEGDQVEILRFMGGG
jgi:thiamine biosynthesis protein ThiS